MASVENHPNLNMAQFGVGHRLSQSDMRFSWRQDPNILHAREFIRLRIAEFLAQNGTGDFGRVIAELSAEFESRLFTAAASKEDYICRETFVDRLRYLVQEKLLLNMSVQQEATYSIPSFSPNIAGPPTMEKPKFNAVPSFSPNTAGPPTMEKLKCNAGENLADTLPDSFMALGTPFSLVGADSYCDPRLTSDVLMSPSNVTGLQAIGFIRGRKRTCQMASSFPDHVASNTPPLVERIPNIQRVDSSLTFSGSVLQYESEASFDSNCKSQHFIEDELDPVVSTKMKSPWMQIQSTLEGDSKLSVDGSDATLMMMSELGNATVEVHPHMPVTESQQYELHEPKLLFEEPSAGNGQSCSRSAQDSNTLIVEPDVLETSALALTSEMYAQPFVGNDHNSVLSCYVKYKSAPKASGLGQVPFLQYMHKKKCKSTCACEKYKLLLDHADQCSSPHCHMCVPVLNLHKDKQRVEELNSEVCVGQNLFGKFALNGSSSVVSEVSPTPSKLRKLNNFTNGEGFSRLHSVSPEASPESLQCSGPPFSFSSSDTKLNVGTNTLCTQSSSSINDPKRDSLEDQQKFCSQNVSPMSEESVDCKQNEMEPTSNNEVRDEGIGSLSSPSSNCVITMSKHQYISEKKDAGIRTDSEEIKLDVTGEQLDNSSGLEIFSRSEKLKMQGVSLTEFFTAEEIKQHMWSLKQDIDQTVVEQEIGNTMHHCISENFCQLCDLDKLWFPPMPIYCSACGNRIKYKGSYYSMLDESGGHVCFCSACHNKSRGANKSKMEMKKNDVVTEESWVQCDKCEGWQHQACALFNDKRDFGGKAEYVCPKCYLGELESGDRNPSPWATCFNASNLPRTVLSDHLEQRLFQRLEKDREDRAKAVEKILDEVPGVSDLVVRVVSSVDKVLKVKQQFLDIFPDKCYPAELPYRSKVILLFQKIEGVDVCLFGMYVQEFGSQCSRPNQRCVYISYLDSVKYFRPETKTAVGEALRTFVYHEILIGYLEYCKRRGFSTCYIWACPPVKGEDYILYCHPETQKTPKPDKLRQWYQSMLRKSTKEKIVVNFTNIYEQFFVPSEGCNTKVTAARLPYFDGDYWSSVVDSMIKKIELECGGDLQKKVKKMTRRSLKAMGHINPTNEEAKDILLMQELGQTFSSAKEDFIIVYLQFVCTRCHEVIASGKRWYCSQCKNFQLCECCHNEDQNTEHTHTASSGQKHLLSQEVVNDVPADTEDNDAIINNCFLENRHALLSFCQGNHYQFDTLRRAKHSSMMILYHLHHPNGAAAGTTCSLCLKDVVVDQQWKCDMCPDFVVCAACYQRNGIGCHTHNLTQTRPTVSLTVENKKAKMVKELLDVLLHASKCESGNTHPCDQLNCLLIRKLFSHARICNVRVAGGCPHCKKTWQVLIIHSQMCRDPNCCVPRCKDLKGLGERQDLRTEVRLPDTTPEVMQYVTVCK